MEKVKHILCSYALDLIMGVGAAAVTIGAGMIYLPAGWIVGGALVSFVIGMILKAIFT